MDEVRKHIWVNQDYESLPRRYLPEVIPCIEKDEEVSKTVLEKMKNFGYVEEKIKTALKSNGEKWTFLKMIYHAILEREKEKLSSGKSGLRNVQRQLFKRSGKCIYVTIGI
jgi:hypothetical protein